MINNKERFLQIVNYDGLKFGKKQGSDVDFCMDIEGKSFIFCEIKYGMSNVNTGQSLLFTNLVHSLRPEVNVHYMIVRHLVKDPKKEVFLKDCIVDSWYDRNECKWIDVLRKKETVRPTIIKKLLEWGHHNLLTKQDLEEISEKFNY